VPAPDDLRVTPVRDGPTAGGEFVLYWMQATYRAHDNPALNYAIDRANELRLPVLVYQGLRADYPWASDRLHTFILESVADLTVEFRERGIPYAFQLEEDPTHRPGVSALVALARRAALVVTDGFPTWIVPQQTRGLARRVECPLVAVDATTAVPQRYWRTAFKTARALRPRLQAALPHFLHPVGDAEPRVRRGVSMPFDPAVPTRGTIPELVARCAIDHSVPPSPTIRGGARAARRRLAHFVESILPHYAESRNDPTIDGTSRMSPYLHFGNISIQEVVLAARDAGPAEAYARFADEALTWRELAHNFVARDRGHRTTAAIPDWARGELADHAADPRDATYTAAALEAAATHEPLWNAFQRSLLRDGELHNYARMLWGKAIIGWTRTTAHALRVAEALNHKYALDGRDPNSYGGILWCFGKFDRPFYRRPVFGTVRYMSLAAARKKFDVPAYLRRHG